MGIRPSDQNCYMNKFFKNRDEGRCLKTAIYLLKLGTGQNPPPTKTPSGQDPPPAKTPRLQKSPSGQNPPQTKSPLCQKKTPPSSPMNTMKVTDQPR